MHFQTTHQKGSLAKVLGAIAEGAINLSKLQSFPIAASEWKYSFHADMEFENPAVFHKVVNELKCLTEMIRVYGVYRKGVK